MARVLVFFSLACLGIKVVLEFGVDVGDFHAVEVYGREGLDQTVAVFPVVAERSR